MLPFDWTMLSSSNVAAVKFTPNGNDALGTLSVEFRSGQTYDYFDVPPAKVESLVHSPSPGEYFRDEIRGSYDTEQKR